MAGLVCLAVAGVTVATRTAFERPDQRVAVVYDVEHPGSAPES